VIEARRGGRDNPAMFLRPAIASLRRWMVVAALLPVAACSWAEWPPPQWQTPPPPVRQGPAPAEGQTAALPPGTPQSPATAPKSDPRFVGAAAVRVGKGDTVYALSRRHKVAVRAIIDANGLKLPYHLRIGQRIVLPRDRVHTVRPGETLYSLSRAYDTDAYTLANANGLRSPYVIREGQRLRIPWRRAAPAVAASPSKPQATVVSRLPAPKAVPRPPRSSGAGFTWPVRGRLISSFGAKSKGLHNDGINIAAPRGTPVKAAENGVVAYAGNELRGFGNLLLIKHASGWVTAYAHNEALLVKRGQVVRRGQVIARVGSTGGVAKPQLHFELRKGKRAVDPKRYLKKSSA